MKHYNSLIVYDLDGTVLNNDLKLTTELIDVTKKLMEQGNYVCIATGRSVSDSYQYYLDLGLNTHMINYNGGLVWDPVSKDVFHRFYLDATVDILTYIIDKHIKYIDNIVLSSDEKTFYLNKNNDYLIDIMFHDMLDRYQMGTKELCKCEKVQRIILSCDPDYLDIIKNDVISHFSNVCIYGWRFRDDIIDISLKCTCKWEALQNMCENSQISFDKIVSFGDASNDMTMINNSDIGVAMINASEDLKKIANYVTDKSNNENGVYDFITNILLAKEIV